MKKILITVMSIVALGFAFPATDLGSSAFYVETTDTLLGFDCPSDGILMIGLKATTTTGFSEGYLYLDGDEIASNESVDYTDGATEYFSVTSTSVVPITQGEHELHSKLTYAVIPEELRVWAIFWAYDTGGAVTEQPRIEPDDLVGSEIHKMGDRISFEYSSTSIYDSTGRLVGRMGPGNWIPTSTGTYFVTYIKDDVAEFRKIVVTN